MCILLKLDFAKFGVSNFFSKKLSKENLWGSARLPSPLVKGGLLCSIVSGNSSTYDESTIIPIHSHTLKFSLLHVCPACPLSTPYRKACLSESFQNSPFL